MKFVIFVVFSLNLFAYGEALVPVCGRTQQVQDEIVRKLKKTDPTITCKRADQVLDYIQILNFKNKGITLLRAGDFSGLSSLKGLFLHHNKLSALPAGLFSGLSSLEWLDLDNNNLSALLAGLFSGLSSLRGLYLHDNNLSALPAGVFSGLPSLIYLMLWRNPLPQVEKDRIKQELPHVSVEF